MALTDEKILAFLKDELQLEADLLADSGLFSTGELDSVAMLGLIGFVEEAAGIQVRPEEVTLENFDTAARIVRFAESRA